ncbi:hypothetical protein II906_10585 [bacterium]|nr:hypothetical protein [bacterium]
MRVNSISFKGYDAAPLKNIYLCDMPDDLFDDELTSICEKENIGCQKVHFDESWAQDKSFIVEKDGEPYFLGAVSKSVKGNSGTFPYGIEGGNTFIGKYPDGQKWMLIGERKKGEIKEEDKKRISQLCNVPEENILLIPKPNFHLDMGIRPIGFPDVLVNDPELAEKALKKLDDGSQEYKNLKKMFDKDKKETCEQYASCDEICSALESRGFNPIRVAGVFYDGINFMNAVVNKHPDGKISYITNSSKCKNHIYNQLQDNFEAELKEKVPSLDKAYFVTGNENCIFNLFYSQRYDGDLVNANNSNFMINNLRYFKGGFHCMTLEEPNFEQWA